MGVRIESKFTIVIGFISTLYFANIVIFHNFTSKKECFS